MAERIEPIKGYFERETHPTIRILIVLKVRRKRIIKYLILIEKVSVKCKLVNAHLDKEKDRKADPIKR